VESPQGPEADVDAAAKERPEEAPFAALRPHGFRPRTWSRRPAAKPTRPNKYYDDSATYGALFYLLNFLFQK